MMINAQTIETVAIKQCPSCAAKLLARDRFCRHCGINQTDNCATAALTFELPSYQTRTLSDDNTTYQSLSGTLVNIVARGVSTTSSAFFASRRAARLIAALATVPIWLLIVLLSPVEAYAAARTITKQI